MNKHACKHFLATKQGERYTLSESARRTVLDRLLALNHQRYAEEVVRGCIKKTNPRPVNRGNPPPNQAPKRFNQSQSLLLTLGCFDPRGRPVDSYDRNPFTQKSWTGSLA